MTNSNVPVVLSIAVAVGMGGAMLGLTHLLGRPRKSRLDRTPYECGSRPVQSLDRQRFSVRFYLVAMLFILFDIEAAFLYPWAVTLREFSAHRWFVLGEMDVFLGILVAGYLYVWWRGALEWE